MNNKFMIYGKPEDASYYDRIYANDPNHWRSDGRDVFAYETMKNMVTWEYGNLLDVGCGTGHTLAYLSHQWTGVALYGIDISPVAVNIARRRLPWVNVVVGSLEEWCYLDPFDLVLMLGVAEHFEDPIKTLSWLSVNLALHGLAYIEVPNCLGYPGMAQIEGFRRLDRGSRQMEWHLRRESWEEMISGAGLEIVARKKGEQLEWEFVWVVRAKSYYKSMLRSYSKYWVKECDQSVVEEVSNATVEV